MEWVDRRQLEFSYTADGSIRWYDCFGNCLTESSNIEYTNSLWPISWSTPTKCIHVFIKISENNSNKNVMKIGEQIICSSEFWEWILNPHGLISISSHLFLILTLFLQIIGLSYSGKFKYYWGCQIVFWSFLLDSLLNNFQIFAHLIFQKDNSFHCLAIFPSELSCYFFYQYLLAVKCAESFQFHCMSPYSV